LALSLKRNIIAWKTVKNPWSSLKFSSVSHYTFTFLVHFSILLFAFVHQCLSKNLKEIHLKRVINYLTKKLREKWAKKVNVECDYWILTKTLKMTGIFHSFSCYYVPLQAENQIYASKCIFSSILILFTLIYCVKSYPTEVKDSLFEVFKLLVCFHTKWGKFRFLVAGSSVHGFLRFLVCDI
jgi:hypothetical protein